MPWSASPAATRPPGIAALAGAPGAFAGNGTVGWRVSSSGEKLTFRDEPGNPDDGITLVEISDRSSHAPNLVRLKIRGLGRAFQRNAVA